LILVDSSGLFAAIVGNQRGHEVVRRVIEAERGPFVLSPFVLAEVDYLVAEREGVDAELALLEEVEAGAYEVASFTNDDVGEARRVVDQYRDLNIGLADASLVVLAARLKTERVLTFDERHFRAIRAPSGRPFALLPADA
jgi:predicted nucleic acid-binding protein